MKAEIPLTIPAAELHRFLQRRPRASQPHPPGPAPARAEPPHSEAGTNHRQFGSTETIQPPHIAEVPQYRLKLMMG